MAEDEVVSDAIMWDGIVFIAPMQGTSLLYTATAFATTTSVARPRGLYKNLLCCRQMDGLQ